MIFSHSCVSPINVLASFAGIKIMIRSRPAEDYKNRKKHDVHEQFQSLCFSDSSTDSRFSYLCFELW